MEDITRRLQARYSAKPHGEGPVPEVYHPDCTFIMANGSVRRRSHFGHEHEVWNTAFPDLTHEYVRSAEQGKYIVFELRMKGTHTGPFKLTSGAELPPTGREISFNACHFAEIQDGLINCDQIFQNPTVAMLQLGLVPIVTDGALDWKLP